MEKSIEKMQSAENKNNESLLLCESKNPDVFPILALAYMGDAVMELFARDYVLNYSGEVKPGALVRASKAIITCEAQSDGIERILNELTEKEMSVFKRGRNAKTHFTPKHGELIQYRRATGFEALMGYLYISGNLNRAKELFLKAFESKHTQ
ncbi:MAG: ribonuclease III [Clostridia bacterium]|nr:ribonuclease III [Clostridia bacterium]